MNKFIMLEEELVDYRVEKLLNHRIIKRQPELRDCLIRMRNEERNYYLAGFTRWHRLLSRLTAMAPVQFICALWLQALIEEYTVGFARCMVPNPKTPTLGKLEPNFVELHKQHIKDEHRQLSSIFG